MMNEKERQIRSIRRAKAIEFLDTFLQENEESEYGVFTYTELLNALNLTAVVERERIKENVILLRRNRV